jgi:hypothetical protein
MPYWCFSFIKYQYVYIDQLSIRLENLKERRNELVQEYIYMKQDIYLLYIVKSYA